MNESLLRQYLRSRNKFWKSRRSLRRSALPNTLLSHSLVCQCLRFRKQIVEVEETIPQRRISECIVDPTDDVPAPQILEEAVEVVRLVPLSKLSLKSILPPRICEQI